MAGPGAGKTHLLVAHAVYLAQTRTGGIVVLTFSRNAAQELARLIAARVPPMAAKRVAARTIHSYALDLLKAYGYRLGLGRPLEVLETRDVGELAQEVASELGEPLPVGFAKKLEQLLRRRALCAEDRAMTSVTGRVLERMRTTGRLSWELCLDLAIELVQTAPDVVESIRHHDRFLLLDEAQDCDPAQLELLERIVADPGGNHLFVAMDLDQSLYAFRDADPERVLEWARRFQPREFELTENFRCAPRIVALARAILRDERPREIPERGLTRFFHGSNRVNEARFVAGQVAQRLLGGTPTHRVAVLGRDNYLIEPVLKVLKEEGTPVRSRPRTTFSQAEQEVLAVLDLLWEWEEQSPLSRQGARTLRRVFNLDGETLDRLEARSLHEESFHPADILDDQRWRDLLHLREKRLHPGHLVREAARALGRDLTTETTLLELAGNARTLSQLLRQARQGAWPSPVRTDGVLVTTFHGSKGLEFDVVFLVACEDGIVPDRRASTQAEIRQEQRALYVAITRASREVVITCVNQDRGRRQKPSRFLPAPQDPLWTRDP